MVSPCLTTAQKELNCLLKKEGFYTFTANEYQSDPHAVELLKRYSTKASQTSLPILNTLLYLQTALQYKKIPNSPMTMQTSIEYYATKSLFGLNNDVLIHKIMYQDYAQAIYQDASGACHFDTALQSKVDTWIQESKYIELYFKQYKMDKALWSANPAGRRCYLDEWKKLCMKPLFNDTHLVQGYVHFLEQKYGLNQKLTCKAKILLNQSLPNITSLSIAKEITTSTSFFY